MADIIIDLDDLRKLFDTAVNSLDFGSGFLDNDEVEALRRVAVALGVDPRVATPLGFGPTYYPDEYPLQGRYAVAMKNGHLGIGYEKVPGPGEFPTALYVCKCGWRGTFDLYEAHLDTVVQS